MTTAALTWVDPGPFDQIVGFAYPTISFRFCLRRDDALVIKPNSADSVDMTLYDEAWDFLFQGNSWGETQLTYEEAIEDLINSFEYHKNYYIITFNTSILLNYVQKERQDFKVYLVTDGAMTLTTTYPRCYTEQQEPVAISPGTYEIALPLWNRTSVTTYTSLISATRTTTLACSIPYRATYSIGNANSLGRFLFPVVGVTWSPNEVLTGWVYHLDITILCPGIVFYLPQQTIQNMTPPPTLPGSHEDRVHTFYNDLVISLALDSCSTLWQATSTTVSTNFGYSGTIPFAPTIGTLFNATFHIPETQSPNLEGTPFSRTFQFIWNRSSFQYDTGHWPNFHYDQTASLTYSPQLGFEAILFTPEPE
ncbi:MAG: hypothetical protein H7839_12630 [Magnetococcus sp. YQC-5]